MPEKIKFARARSLTLKYLSYRDRSQSEIEAYLAKKNATKDAADEVIQYLKNLNYINDEQFALNWGKFRLKNKQLGKYRLQQELLGKGLSQKNVSKAIQALYSEIDEFQLALSCAEKKIQTYKTLDSKTKNQFLAQFLQRKGFSSNIIFKVLNL